MFLDILKIWGLIIVVGALVGGALTGIIWAISSLPAPTWVQVSLFFVIVSGLVAAVNGAAAYFKEHGEDTP